MLVFVKCATLMPKNQSDKMITIPEVLYLDTGSIPTVKNFSCVNKSKIDPFECLGSIIHTYMWIITL